MRFFIIAAIFIASVYADGLQDYKNEAHKGFDDAKDSIYNHGMTLECDFGMVRHYWGEMYTCITRNLATHHHYDYIVNATGDHLSGKTDADVEAIYVLGQRVRFLPYNISTPFKGVRAIRVEDSKLMYLNRTLAYEGALEYLHLENNLLRTVPAWAFRGLTSLKWLSLRNNRIKYMEASMFRDLKALRRLSVSSNLIEVIPSGLFFYTPELEEVYFYNNRIRMIGGSLVRSLTKLKVASFMGNACTQVSVYDGIDIINKLSTEFVSKCNVNCQKTEEAAKKEIEELKKEVEQIKRCHVQMQDADRQNEYQYRHPGQPRQSSESHEY